MVACKTVTSGEWAKKLNEKFQASQSEEPQNSNDSFQYATEGEELVFSETEHVTFEFHSSMVGSNIAENLGNHFV